MEKKIKKRVMMAEVEEISAAHDATIFQHPITKHFTLVLSSGGWGWVINPHTDIAVTRLSDLTIEEWTGVIEYLAKHISNWG